MKCMVRVSHETQDLTWEIGEELQAQEFNQITSYLESKPQVNPYWFPVRTHRAGLFLHDLFLPTTFSRAARSSYLIVRIFERIVFCIKDIATLPARLLNAFPRILTNSIKERHPLYQYLRNHGAPESLLELDSVHTHWTFTYLDQNVYGNTIEVTFGQEKDVNFIELPETGDLLKPIGLDYRSMKV